jgi:hypothetical protein
LIFGEEFHIERSIFDVLMVRNVCLCCDKKLRPRWRIQRLAEKISQEMLNRENSPSQYIPNVDGEGIKQ